MYGILIYDGVEPIDIGATFGVLSMARRLAPELDYVGVARQAGPVTCANGLIVHADHGFDDCPPLTDLVVTGGPGWVAAADDQPTLAFLKESPARVSSICTGALIVASAGLLQGRKAATKTAVFAGESAPRFSDASIQQTDAAVVEDEGSVSGGGVTLGIDVMFHLLARSHGESVADETARVMEYDRALAINKAERGHAIA